MRIDLNSDGSFPAPAAAEPAAAGAGLRGLDQLATGDWLVVAEVQGSDELAARLTANGFWPGTVVECLGRGPFGEPLRVRLHGFRLALRRNEAARVRGQQRPAPQAPADGSAP